MADVKDVRAVVGVPQQAKKQYEDCGMELVLEDRCITLLAETQLQQRLWLDQLALAKRLLQGSATEEENNDRGTVLGTLRQGTSPLFMQVGGWTAEDAEHLPGQRHYHTVVENPESLVSWYRVHFVTKKHVNFLGNDEKLGAMAVSIKREVAGGEQYVRGIFWSQDGIRHVLARDDARDYRADLHHVLRNVGPQYAALIKRFFPVSADDVRTALLQVEDMESPFQFKFGLLYGKQGQTGEVEMLGNDIVGDKDGPFSAFLDLIGTRIPLKGWDGYKAGLDVTDGNTGVESVFTEHRGYDIMFHVSALLPHDREDSGQHVQRKRQIGNDVTCIVFMDGTTPYDPSSIKCQFLHVFAVVQPDTTPGRYRVSFARQQCVVPYGPPLETAVWNADAAFIDFLLTKMVNGERSALRSAPAFAPKQRRTQGLILSSVYSAHKDAAAKRAVDESVVMEPLALELCPGAKRLRPLGGPRSNIPVLQHPPKVVDTSLVHTKTNAVAVKCMALWANSILLYSTEAGVFLEVLGQVSRGVCFTAEPMQQMVVTHNPCRLVALSVSGDLYTLDLASVLYNVSTRGQTGDPNQAMLEGPKRGITFDANTVDGKLMVCCAYKGGKVALFEWDSQDKVFAPSKAFTPPVDVSAVVMVRWLRGGLILGHATHITYVLHGGEMSVLFQSPHHSIVPRDVLHVSPGIVAICYDRKTIFVELQSRKQLGLELNWTGMPTCFAVCPPYMLAQSSSHVEVRSLLGGAVVQSLLPRPPLRLVPGTSRMPFIASMPCVNDTKDGRDFSLRIYQIRHYAADGTLADPEDEWADEDDEDDDVAVSADNDSAPQWHEVKGVDKKPDEPKTPTAPRAPAAESAPTPPPPTKAPRPSSVAEAVALADARLREQREQQNQQRAKRATLAIGVDVNDLMTNLARLGTALGDSTESVDVPATPCNTELELGSTWADDDSWPHLSTVMHEVDAMASPLPSPGPLSRSFGEMPTTDACDPVSRDAGPPGRPRDTLDIVSSLSGLDTIEEQLAAQRAAGGGTPRNNRSPRSPGLGLTAAPAPAGDAAQAGENGPAPPAPAPRAATGGTLGTPPPPPPRRNKLPAPPGTPSTPAPAPAVAAPAPAAPAEGASAAEGAANPERTPPPPPPRRNRPQSSPPGLLKPPATEGDAVADAQTAPSGAAPAQTDAQGSATTTPVSDTAAANGEQTQTPSDNAVVEAATAATNGTASHPDGKKSPVREEGVGTASGALQAPAVPTVTREDSWGGATAQSAFADLDAAMDELMMPTTDVAPVPARITRMRANSTERRRHSANAALPSTTPADSGDKPASVGVEELDDLLDKVSSLM